VYLAYHLAFDGDWPQQLADPAVRRSFAREQAIGTVETFQACDPIWCDPPMVDLISAASDTFPVGPFREHELPAPNGFLLFAKPLPAVWQLNEPNLVHQEPLTAISWGSGLSIEDKPILSIATWKRGHGTVRYHSPPTTVRYNGLQLVSHVIGHYGAPMQDCDGPAGPNKILQTFAALSRAPVVREESGMTGTSFASFQRARAAGVKDPRIRRLYLLRPEQAAEELADARAARAGKPRRGHWVRGHWRRQWFPSVGQHNAVWIERHSRGDFGLGEVSGSKVLVASGNRVQAEGATPSTATRTDVAEATV
jgi:hypothetical protein